MSEYTFFSDTFTIRLNSRTVIAVFLPRSWSHSAIHRHSRLRLNRGQGQKRLLRVELFLTALSDTRQDYDVLLCYGN